MLTKLIQAVVIIILCLGSSITYADYLCSDANNDGKINVSDAVYLINFVFSQGPVPYRYCCEDCPYMVTDVDGNTYKTVFINDKCWMLENLKVESYRNGDPIPNISDVGEWSGLLTGAYCDYDNNSATGNTYGHLYNWYAINDSRGLAPEGWHVATDEEFKQLEMYLGMSQTNADAIDWRGISEGGKLKETGTAHWQAPNVGATNESGFAALPNGYRSGTGIYQTLYYYGFIWTPSIGGDYYRSLGYNHADIKRAILSKKSGLAIRCVKD